MQMTNEEIVRDYNQAANKSKQIKVLAELNCVSPGEIKAVLAQAGVPGVKMPERIRPRKATTAGSDSAAVPDRTVYERIEAILDSLPEASTDYTIERAEELVLGLLKDYVWQRLGKAVRDEA